MVPADQEDQVVLEADREGGMADNMRELLVGNNHNHHTEDKTYLLDRLDFNNVENT